MTSHGYHAGRWYPVPYFHLRNGVPLNLREIVLTPSSFGTNFKLHRLSPFPAISIASVFPLGVEIVASISSGSVPAKKV